MKKKARISRQLLILFFEIQSCSTLKNIIYDRQIREAEHELEKLKELISLSDIYPALARENEVEAIIEYKIEIDKSCIGISITIANFTNVNGSVNDEKNHLLSKAFITYIYQSMCSKGDEYFKEGEYQISIAYKLKNSNFYTNQRIFKHIIYII